MDSTVSAPGLTIKGTDTKIDGFLLGDRVLVNVHHRVLQYFTHGIDQQHPEDIVRMGATEMRLLAYLLQHANGTVVPYNTVLITVWVHTGLAPSYSRLSQVRRKVNGKLSRFGLPPNFIRTVRDQGYCIEGHVITPLYCGVRNLLFQAGD
ncbi:winged helix-turn-helix domain-containing protein [Yersinia intermedia]|uniref:OmpR/PhoB-type domain-containing protein n=1 Tax=Yersinia intermedia TaxID=631 RepID=A0A208ZYG4_YERIN|nr:winged helix-turn-helix domain-containing protein [Yersinia intermedia]OVZ85483.1 hypothetical protein CBW57_14040 [Yersinia intermedia]